MTDINNQATVGIDPGEKGGIAVIDDYSIRIYNMPDTYPEIYELLKRITHGYWAIHVFLERVGFGIPGQSSSATAKFARHNGHIEMALYALSLPTVEVTPQKWQKYYSNQVGTSKGLSKTEWKGRLKGVAQRLYPSEKITLNTADAVLIAHYGKNNKL